MKNSILSLLCATILIVGLINAYVLAQGMTQFNRNFQFKEFSSSAAAYAPPPIVTAPSANRFVIVDGGKISLYSADANGKLRRTDDVSPYGAELKPAAR